MAVMAQRFASVDGQKRCVYLSRQIIYQIQANISKPGLSGPFDGLNALAA